MPRARRIILMLVLGALTTIAVAWGLSYRAEGIKTGDGLIERKYYTIVWNTRRGDLVAAGIRESRWTGVTHVSGGRPMPPQEARDALPPEFALPRWAVGEVDTFAVAPELLRWDAPLPDPATSSPLLVAAGWPLRAVSCTAQFGFGDSLMSWPGMTDEWLGPGAVRVCSGGFAVERGLRASESGYILQQPPALVVPLPFRPVWPGFALDTAIFSALWALPIFGFPIARRFLRRRRGLCPSCAYSFAGLAPNSPCPECGHSRKV